ncbi:MAG: tetratricopeptide repeat protein [Bacteroidales bacterium]|nr:tetratricopeptide repeat protein [Bacteroidales bacterium]
MIKLLRYTLLSVFAFLMVSCSTEKNTAITRTYHHVTSRYNILFNGREAYKKGILTLEETYKDDFTELIPVFLYTDKDAISTIAPDMDRAIKKATKLISMHSLTIKPEVKPDKELSEKQKEFYSKKQYNKWVDNAYLLMGKAHFYKMEYGRAKETFNYILSNFNESATVFEARLWLARLACEEERFREAEDYLSSLSRNIAFPKSLKNELESTWADFYIKQEKYKEAIVPLIKAIEKTGKKSRRSRLTYLLAQVYALDNNNALASEYYDKVVRMNPPYEMAFNAKINRALSYQSGAGSMKDIEKQLQKMLKDDKNIDYLDQIYFALGNLYFKDKSVNKAIEYYKQSMATSKDNTRQKAKTSLTLADLYYAQPDYMNAQAYYDSAVAFISSDYPGYDLIFTKSVSLNNLVTYYNTVIFEDSVLALSTMPEDDLTFFIEDLIVKQKQLEEEERIREQEREQRRIEAEATAEQFQASDQSNKWYFYNPTASNLGKKEFNEIWGNRKLEDNWRRSNKSTLSFDEIETAEGSEELEEGTSKTENLITNKHSPDYYLQYIPFTDSAKTESHKRIANALYRMGDIYADELKDYNRAAETFEELLKRYPDYDNKLQVYYKLYIVAKNSKDKQKLAKYQQKIISEYPESNFAKLMTNPNYVQEILAQEQKVYNIYADTYKDFSRNRHTSVINHAEKAMLDYPDHELYSKFDYMYTVSSGILKDTLSFVKDLQDFISRYSTTDLAENAKIIITYLQTKEPDLIIEQQREEAREIFISSNDDLHYFAYVIPNTFNHNQLVFNIITFNLDYFDELKLDVKKVDIKGDYNLCLVSSFHDGDEANNYLKRIKEESSISRDVNIEEITPVIISQINYEKLLENGNAEQYILFFSENYQH